MNKLTSYTIEYIDSKGKESTREILTLTEVPKNLNALDLSTLTETEKQTLIDYQNSYNEYVTQYLANMASFDNWLSMTTNEQTLEEVKKLTHFKKFTVSNIKSVK